MQISTIFLTAIAMASSGSASALPNTSNAVTVAAAAAGCSPGYNYCGWYLKTLGFPTAVDQYLYNCDSVGSASVLERCNKCDGPTAHCV